MLDCDKGESSRFPLNLSFRVSKCRLKLYSTNIAIDPGSTEEGSAADSYDPILGSDKIESTPIGKRMSDTANCFLAGKNRGNLLLLNARIA